jgi:hypothetical protein
MLQGFIPGANTTQTQQAGTTGNEGIGNLLALLTAVKGGMA